MTSSRALAPLLLLAPLLAGCASGPEAAPPEPLRLAVIAAPRVGQEAPADGGPDALSAEDLLLETVTQLSAMGELHYVLVPGPLLARPEAELHASLVGAVGSLAAPVVLGLAEADGPRDELLEALGEALREHAGEAGQWGPVREGWRALALGPQGEWPAKQEEQANKRERRGEDEAPPRLLVVHGAPPAERALARAALVVTTGEEAALRQVDGRVHLVVPPLTRPPHELALVVVGPERVTVRLRSLTGAERELPPLPLPASGER